MKTRKKKQRKTKRIIFSFLPIKKKSQGAKKAAKEGAHSLPSRPRASAAEGVLRLLRLLRLRQRLADVVRHSVAAAQQEQHLVGVGAAQGAGGAHPGGVLR